MINGVPSGTVIDHVGAASEGEAVAVAARVCLADRKTVVMCENSGLDNAVNPVASLTALFRIPMERGIRYLICNAVDGDHRERCSADKRANFPSDVKPIAGVDCKLRV